VAAYANGMRDLLDVLGVEAATLVGHSLGGEALRTSRLEIFAGAGHFPHHDPDRFVALVREFVATTEPARHDREAWRERLGQGA
jgi:pimeloyl-ACP methyl ester carboxylesterase